MHSHSAKMSFYPEIYPQIGNYRINSKSFCVGLVYHDVEDKSVTSIPLLPVAVRLWMIRVDCVEDAECFEEAIH